jgi:hypothetical protein
LISATPTINYSNSYTKTIHFKEELLEKRTPLYKSKINPGYTFDDACLTPWNGLLRGHFSLVIPAGPTDRLQLSLSPFPPPLIKSGPKAGGF